MRVPIAMRKNLITGEETFTYAETTPEEFGEQIAKLYNKLHPEEQIVVVRQSEQDEERKCI
jgi:hypothetical protein